MIRAALNIPLHYFAFTPAHLRHHHFHHCSFTTSASAAASSNLFQPLLFQLSESESNAHVRCPWSKRVRQKFLSSSPPPLPSSSYLHHLSIRHSLSSPHNHQPFVAASTHDGLIGMPTIKYVLLSIKPSHRCPHVRTSTDNSQPNH
jgi:hypothetical protein